MRYGLLALSLAMLCGGGFAAQSALAITVDATSGIGAKPRAVAMAERGDRYGSLRYTADREEPTRLALN